MLPQKLAVVRKVSHLELASKCLWRTQRGEHSIDAKLDRRIEAFHRFVLGSFRAPLRLAIKSYAFMDTVREFSQFDVDVSTHILTRRISGGF